MHRAFGPVDGIARLRFLPSVYFREILTLEAFGMQVREAAHDDASAGIGFVLPLAASVAAVVRHGREFVLAMMYEFVRYRAHDV